MTKLLFLDKLVNMKRLVFSLLIIANFASFAFAQKNLQIFRRAYPDLKFSSKFNHELDDHLVTVRDGEREIEFLWANGSLIPAENGSEKQNSRSLLYNYPKELADPANFSEEQVQRIKQFSSPKNRRNGAGTPMHFFDFVYNSFTRADLEEHIVTVNFLNRNIRVHQRIVEKLETVENRIFQEAKSDSDVQAFLDELKSVDAYFWREIAGTSRKSFHSLGIAIDFLPKNLKNKAIFWSWTRDLDPENWMLTPLSQRWMPPQKVIEIFEEQGFIWGGKWGIWDNMHFEYRPELIIFQKQNR